MQKKLKIKTILVIAIIALSFVGCKAENRNKEINYKHTKFDVSERAKNLLDQMTLKEKIGQMVQAERNNVSKGDIRNYLLGSVLSGGGSTPHINNPKSWRKMVYEFQEEALSTRLEIPIIYGVDAVHGHNNVYGATIFPHNIGMGATRDSGLVRRVAEITANEVFETGIKWNFSPCLAVVRNEKWGRTYESFGESPEIQELLVKDFIVGMQGDPENEYLENGKIIACAKHYIGDGGTTNGIDRGNTEISEEELRNIHLKGFLEAIEAKVGTIMVSFSSWNGLKMHEHKYLITDVLKNELKFEGFVISDWNGVHEVAGIDLYEKVVKSVNSGIDMLMEPDEWKNVISILEKATIDGDISESRIDDAVYRILKVKYRAGLFEEPYFADENVSKVGSEEHREIAREAVRKSLVLLKNNNNILPLKKDSKILLTGPAIDDIGYQSGGWTISWQGSRDILGRKITEGTTILEAFEVAVEAEGGEIITNIQRKSEANVIVVVVGEKPYAEGAGDSMNLKLGVENINHLKRAYSTELPVVVIMISGRPLMISDEIDKWDGFVQAWLPGTEGNGISDVLFGDYNFQGKLPITWARRIEQIPINVSNLNYMEKNVLFRYGYGLSYEN